MAMTLEEDTAVEVDHIMHSGPLLLRGCSQAWSVGGAMSMAEYDISGNVISKSQYWHRGPGVQAGRGKATHSTKEETAA